MPPVLHNYGNVMNRLRRYEEAIDVYNKALSRALKVPLIYSDIGIAQRELGRIENAIVCFQKAPSLDSNFTPALFALPNAVMIHMVRNPVNACISCLSKLFKSGEQKFSYDMTELGRYYIRYQRLMNNWRRVLPSGRILDVKYEELVTDIEAQVRGILDHYRLPWDAHCLAFHDTDRPIRTASAMQVRRSIYTSSVERWRVYEPFLGPLLGTLGFA